MLDHRAVHLALQVMPTAESVSDRFLDVRAKLERASNEDPEFGTLLSQSLEVVRQALDLFGSSGLAISFNGGKDACVVFYLLLLVLAERNRVHVLCTFHSKGIPVVYFEKEEFPEMEDFMRNLASELGVNFRTYEVSYREGMRDLVENHDIKGVIMGQRRGDPGTEDMGFLTSSTPGWPQFTRVNPALEWKYHHVWQFLRGGELPYCCLYDQGYTSLGERGDTTKNEALRLRNGDYLPAYALKLEHLERSPRTPSGGREKTATVENGGRAGGTAVAGANAGAGGDAGNAGVDGASRLARGTHFAWGVDGGTRVRELFEDDDSDEGDEAECMASPLTGAAEEKGVRKACRDNSKPNEGGGNKFPVASSPQGGSSSKHSIHKVKGPAILKNCGARLLSATALIVIILASLSLRRPSSPRGL